MTLILFQHDNINLNNLNTSYDDLPPPPPPLSSSPSPPCPVSDSDNSDSVVTAQMPVPQTRSSIRRNEYVNIPVQPQVSQRNHTSAYSLSIITFSLCLSSHSHAK